MTQTTSTAKAADPTAPPTATPDEAASAPPPQTPTLVPPPAAPVAPAPKSAAKPAAKPAPKPLPAVPVRPVASPAQPRRRHFGIALTFLLLVVAPVAAAGWYLTERAADQFSSTLGFTVRSEDISSAVDILGGLGSALGGGGGGSGDADILYEFVRSQEMVSVIDAQLGLRSLYSRHAETDPLFSFDQAGTIEDLTAYWQRMVRISYDSGSGLMELRVLAFDPLEARAIAEAIFDESSRMINELSAIARADATRYANEDLERAVERLKTAREELTAFRVANQIVDPQADIQSQMGLLARLQEQQASALIELAVLSDVARDGDPRLDQARRRIEIIEDQIRVEREKFGDTAEAAPGTENYATTIAEFERLSVDREFAERAYAAALSAYDGALAEANRQSRYLAAYIRPTLAERSIFPQRWLLISLVALFAFMTWAIGTLIYYSLRDRR